METLPAPQPLLPDYICLNAKWHTRRLALVCGNTRLTWGELSGRINQVANFLGVHQLKKGDRAAVLMSNGVPMFEMLLGTMTAGVVSVPINVSISTESLLAMIQNSGSRALFVSQDQLHHFEDESVRQRLFSLGVQCFCAFEEQNNKSNRVGFESLIDGVDQQSTEFSKVDFNGLDHLNIIYSSGTTGDPKGIVHTHQGRRDWALDLALALRVHSHAVTMLNIGLYSNISWAGILTTLIMGGTCVIHKKFDAIAFLHTVEQEKITHCAMVPVQYQRILTILEAQSFELRSCVGMTSCGSPLFERTKKQLFKHFPCGIIELYGLTEGVITTLSPEDAEGRWDSVGKPMPGVDIKLVDEQGREVSAGHKGEIVSRSRVTMPCYYNRNEATEAAKWIDSHGIVWMRTGDVGILDEEGFLYIVDRKKDMIISGGQNIYPQDIEAKIAVHVNVEDVAVIGAPSKNWGETPIALIVAKDINTIDVEDMKKWCNDRLGRQQKISDVIEVESLPRNANGKILKRELRKRFENKKYD
ncbi:MAG: acyl--CoA ligase [Agarilytica sp.]